MKHPYPQKVFDVLKFFDIPNNNPNLLIIYQTFQSAALVVCITLPDNPETVIALRKLLEAKEAAIRSAMFVSKPGLKCNEEPHPKTNPRYLKITKIPYSVKRHGLELGQHYLIWPDENGLYKTKAEIRTEYGPVFLHEEFYSLIE